MNIQELAILSISDLTVSYQNKGGKEQANKVLNKVSLALKPGEIHVLLGQSGSGKSTLLRAVAGFHTPVEGNISIDGKTVAKCSEGKKPEIHEPPDKRCVGFVFQDYALFPHMSLEKNVRYGAKNEEKYVKQLIEMISLSDKKKRRPDQLSGGERQRVALARAMAMRPKLLLLDEPFSNLDPLLRSVLRENTFQIVREAELATILVTHSPEEAMAVADSISVLSGGNLLQTGAPRTLYYSPKNEAVAVALGPAEFLDAHHDGTTITAPIALAKDALVTENEDQKGCYGQGKLVVRPGSFQVDNEGSPAQVVRKTFLGELLQVDFKVGDSIHSLSLPSNQEIEDTFHLSIRRAHWIPLKEN